MQSVTLPVPGTNGNDPRQHQERKLKAVHCPLPLEGVPFTRVQMPLAVEFGIPAAFIIAKIDSWLQSKGREQEDGKKWIYMSLPQLHRELPCFTFYAIKKAVKELEGEGVLLGTRAYSLYKPDRTTWRAIDYERLSDACRSVGSFDSSSVGSFDSPSVDSFDSPSVGSFDSPSVDSSDSAIPNISVLNYANKTDTAENVLTFVNSEGTEAEEEAVPGVEAVPEAIALDVREIAEQIGKAAGAKREGRSEPEQTPEPSPAAPEAVEVILRELEGTNAEQTAQLRDWTERRDVQQLPTQVLLAVLNRILTKRNSEKPVQHYVAFAQSTAETLYTKWQSAEEQSKLARECSLRESQRTQEKLKEQEEWKVTSPSTCNLTASVKAIRERLAVGDEEGAKRASLGAMPEAEHAAQPGAMAEAA